MRKELRKRDLVAPMGTVPKSFMELIRQHYRNAILRKIADEPFIEI